MSRKPRDRGALLTRTLLALGLGLLAVVVVALVLRGPSQHGASPGSTAPGATTTAPASTTAPPQTRAAPPAPAPLRVVALTPFSATVAWRTEAPTTGRLSLALGGDEPTVWSEPVGPSLEHEATVGGLALDSDYRAEAGGHTLAFHTPRPTGTIVASTAGGAVLLDGQPFFPLMVWGECPTAYDAAVAAGVNLFAENPCGGADAQVNALDGRALSAGVAGAADWQNPSLIGWFYPDEADARHLTARTLPALPPSSQVGRISFLTLSNHVFSRASPPPGGRRVYPGLLARADVVGFDLYPLQEWCSRELDLVWEAQRELVARAPGKPTFQWIEAAPMRCRGRPGVAVTPTTVRAEALLAVAAGAHGLGFFPGEWSPAVGAAIGRVAAELKSVAPALLGPALPVESGVPAAARTLDGALYVVAVNPARRPVAARVAVAGAGSRSFAVLGESRRVAARDGVLSDRLPPLAARIYVAPPT